MKKTAFLFFLMLIVLDRAIGQPLPPPPPNTAIPFDIIAGVLIGAGLVYGIIRLVRSRKAKQASA